MATKIEAFAGPLDGTQIEMLGEHFAFYDKDDVLHLYIIKGGLYVYQGMGEVED